MNELLLPVGTALLEGPGFNVASEMAKVTDAISKTDISPVIAAIVGLVPMIMGATLLGIGIRKGVSWFKKGANSI